MKTGHAILTATTQRFIDTCDAVKSWTAIDDDSAMFEYDETIEVPIVPEGIVFDA